MSYDYQKEREWVFSDEGQRQLLKIRDKARNMFSLAGACTVEKAMSGCTGSSWGMLACVDRLIELEEIKRIDNPNGAFSQYAILVPVEYHGR